MSQKDIQNTGENTENQNQDQNQDTGKKIEINAYYMIHEDLLPDWGLELMLLTSGNKRWHIIKKIRKGVPYYYVFYNDNNYIKRYIKMWKDRRNNLLYYIGEYHGNWIYTNYVNIVEDQGCVIELPNEIVCNGKEVIFNNIPFVEEIRQLGRDAVDAVVWTLCNELY